MSLKTGGLLQTSGNPPQKVNFPTKSSPKLLTLVFLHISVTVAMEARSPVISFISVVNLPVNRGRVLARCYQTTPCDGGPSKAQQQWCVITTRAAMTSPRKQNEILTIWMAFYPSSLHLILHELPTQTPRPVQFFPPSQFFSFIIYSEVDQFTYYGCKLGGMVIISIIYTFM